MERGIFCCLVAVRESLDQETSRSEMEEDCRDESERRVLDRVGATNQVGQFT